MQAFQKILKKFDRVCYYQAANAIVYNPHHAYYSLGRWLEGWVRIHEKGQAASLVNVQ